MALACTQMTARVVSNFIVQALKGEPVTLYGDGHPTRSFCYVDDLVSGLIALMDAPDNVIGPVNLGNPCEFTINELAQKVIAMTGSSSGSYPSIASGRSYAALSRHRSRSNAAGLAAGNSLEDGLKRTIDYFARVI